ncbi:MAG: hypothetical protein H0U97_14740 [Gammaproteobacteria bacterium]|nr:hypothetical protein [Gammaproteobacteria bacterium]
MEAARRLGVSRQRVLELCREGRVQGARKPGHRWQIPAGAKIRDPSRRASRPLRTTEIPPPRQDRHRSGRRS